MARRKQGPKDLTGIRQRGGTYQVRLFGGRDPVTGKQVVLTGSADDEDAAIKLRDKFRRRVAEATAARTSVTLVYLLDQWLADHQVIRDDPAVVCHIRPPGRRRLAATSTTARGQVAPRRGLHQDQQRAAVPLAGR